MLIPKEKPPITVVGDVGGRIAIIVVSEMLSLLINYIKHVKVAEIKQLFLVSGGLLIAWGSIEHTHKADWEL